MNISRWVVSAVGKLGGRWVIRTITLGVGDVPNGWMVADAGVWAAYSMGMERAQIVDVRAV